MPPMCPPFTHTPSARERARWDGTVERGLFPIRCPREGSRGRRRRFAVGATRGATASAGNDIRSQLSISSGSNPSKTVRNVVAQRALRVVHVVRSWVTANLANTGPVRRYHASTVAAGTPQRCASRIKANAARTNADLGLLDREIAEKIAAGKLLVKSINIDTMTERMLPQ